MPAVIYLDDFFFHSSEDVLSACSMPGKTTLILLSIVVLISIFGMSCFATFTLINFTFFINFSGLVLVEFCVGRDMEHITKQTKVSCRYKIVIFDHEGFENRSVIWK